jgi:uncharacterized protein
MFSINAGTDSTLLITIDNHSMKKNIGILFTLITLLTQDCYSSIIYYKNFTFVNKRGDTLQGKLITPSLNESANFPVIIFLVGSARSAFDKNYEGFIKENFERFLLEKGIGLCYFNKPGIGLSQGKWYKQNFQDRVNDTKSCIDFLKGLPSIDSSRIGVIGHSQGGWIAQMVAAQLHKDVRFAVSLAGPSYSVKNQLVSDFTSSLTCKGVEKSKALRLAKRKTNFVFTLASIFPLNENLKQLQRIRKYKPDNSIRNISIPFLFMFGENDKLVYYDWCLDSLNNIFNEKIPPNIQLKVINGANHSFEVEPFCSDTKRKDLSYSKEFQDILVSFVEVNMK